MAQDILKIESILKDKYLPALKNQIGTEPSPFLEKVKKVPLTNNEIVASAPIGLNGGFGFGYEGTNVPDPNAQQYQVFKEKAKDMYVSIKISDKTIKLASSDASSMLNALNQEVQGSYVTAKWNLARALFGDGTGKLATVTANAVASNEVTVSDTSKLREGLTIDFYETTDTTSDTPDIAKRRITAVDHVNNKITIDGSATAVKAGFITVQNSHGREITGLGAIMDSAITTIYGLTKADNAWINPLTKDVNHDFTDIAISELVRDSRDYKGGNIDMLLCGDKAYAQYLAYMKENNTVNSDKLQFKGGVVGMNVLLGDHNVTVVNERNVPTAEAWGVDTTCFELHATEWDWATKDGGIFTLISGTSYYNALLACYGNLICKNPGSCIKFTNCDAAA